MQQALKILVAVLGLLILAAFGVIAVTLANRMSGADGAASGKPRGGFGAVALGLPAGTTIAAASAEGSRLVLTARLPDGRERIVVVDMESGRVLGTVDPTAAP